MARLVISCPTDVRLYEKGMSIGEALAAFDAAYPDAGATASFIGKVRQAGGVKALELSHYAPLTLPGLQDLGQSLTKGFALEGILIWHRIGVMKPGQPIVLVAAAAPHRRAAFDAVDCAMDHLKSAAWLWKRERRADGWHWIQPRGDDYRDLQRWE